MADDRFREPIFVFTGIGRQIDIASTCEALAFLDTCAVEVAADSRIAAHRACLTVLDGKAEPDEAKQALSSFAREAGILVAKPGEVVMRPALQPAA